MNLLLLISTVQKFAAKDKLYFKIIKDFFFKIMELYFGILLFFKI